MEVHDGVSGLTESAYRVGRKFFPCVTAKSISAGKNVTAITDSYSSRTTELRVDHKISFAVFTFTKKKKKNHLCYIDILYLQKLHIFFNIMLR